MLSYLEISKINILHNYTQFKNYVHPKTKVIAVVKGNAYGHGLAQVVQILDEHTDMFAVNSIEELEILRRYSSVPALVLGYIPKKQLEQAVLLNGTLVMYDIERLKILNNIGEALNKRPKVHIKIDAFLGRQGILPPEIKDFTKQLKQFNKLDIEAIYAHFANIEDIGNTRDGKVVDFTHAQKQIDILNDSVKYFVKNINKNIKTHISSTAGILAHDKNTSINNFVRLGIGLYGMWPSEQVRAFYSREKIDLRPALRWVTHIAQVKIVPAGTTIAYDLTYTTSKETKIAIVPQGYSDGYDRKLSNRGEVLIQGQRCKVLGRVMMNMFVVDVSNLNKVQAEDEVVLLGSQGQDTITAEEIATHTETINYEITTRLSGLLPRLID